MFAFCSQVSLERFDATPPCDDAHSIVLVYVVAVDVVEAEGLSTHRLHCRTVDLLIRQLRYRNMSFLSQRQQNAACGDSIEPLLRSSA